jgi:hypothetical protein
MTNQILDGYNGYAIEVEKKILQLECKVMEFVTLTQKLEDENVRLRVIIERAKEWTKNSFNESKLIEILNQAGKGEGYCELG